jgi:hypothetical protein
MGAGRKPAETKGRRAPALTIGVSTYRARRRRRQRVEVSCFTRGSDRSDAKSGSFSTAARG